MKLDSALPCAPTRHPHQLRSRQKNVSIRIEARGGRVRGLSKDHFMQLLRYRTRQRRGSRAEVDVRAPSEVA